MRVIKNWPWENIIFEKQEENIGMPVRVAVIFIFLPITVIGEHFSPSTHTVFPKLWPGGVAAAVKGIRGINISKVLCMKT